MGRLATPKIIRFVLSNPYRMGRAMTLSRAAQQAFFDDRCSRYGSIRESVAFRENFRRFISSGIP